MTSVFKRYARMVPGSGGNHPASAGDDAAAPVVLMVSGGADSTALLVLAATSSIDIGDGRGLARVARERLHVLHVNHQLRGIGAEEDEEFVCDLAARYGIPCTVRRIDVKGLAAAARAVGGADAANIEALGRDARYAAARDLVNELSASVGTPHAAARILTAHTADDRAETFFMNALRGTGPAGLASIPRQRGRIVRPLLDRSHAELCELLRMRGIVWREDETNADTRYLRAFVRHEVMPTLVGRNPHVVANVSTTCDILGDEDAYLTRVAMRSLRDLTRRQDKGMLVLDAARLGAMDVAIARRVIRSALIAVCPSARLEARHIAGVLASVAAGTGATMVPVDVTARVEYGLLFVRVGSRIDDVEPIAAWIEVPGLGSQPAHEGPSQRRSSSRPAARESSSGTVWLSNGRMLTARLVRVPAGSRAPDLARAHASEWEGQSVLLDAGACGIDETSGGHLWVDVPVAGDVIRPLGMHGQSKKLSDLLNEAHIPVADRANLPIVRSGPTGAILWVGGLRPSEDARCTADSHTLLELTLGDDPTRILP